MAQPLVPPALLGSGGVAVTPATVAPRRAFSRGSLISVRVLLNHPDDWPIADARSLVGGLSAVETTVWTEREVAAQTS
jgi:hypothetical protein